MYHDKRIGFKVIFIYVFIIIIIIIIKVSIVGREKVSHPGICTSKQDH